MRIQSAEYHSSVIRADRIKAGGLPEIAFCGRSNCGKSTLLNTVTGRKGLARTSKTPGRTQTINFFKVNGSLYFVDLPGFGFAKVPKKTQHGFGELITDYIRNSVSLRGVVFLLDIRHKPSVQDCAMQGLIVETGVPTVYVATKSDKIGTTKRAKHLRVIRETLELSPEACLVTASAIGKKGMREVLRGIDEQILGQNSDNEAFTDHPLLS